MENQISIEQVLDKMDISVVNKKTKSPIESILIIVASIIFLVLNNLAIKNLEAFGSLFVFISTGLFVWGILSLLFRKKYYINTQTNQKLKKQEILIDLKDRDKLLRFLKERNYPELKNLKLSKFDGLKLRFMATEDCTLCFTQVNSYISNEFVNLTEVQTHKDQDAKKLFEAIKSIH